MNETRKAYKRRKRLGFFDMFVKGKVIDIGCGRELENLIIPTAIPYDISIGSGDATFMEDIRDESFDTVYTSHLLEHIEDQDKSLRNWFRILKIGGHLIVSVPDRDLYEKKKKLPSEFAYPVHKRFYKLYEEDLPDTYSIINIYDRIFKDCAKLVWAYVVDEGYNYYLEKFQPPEGEYAIETVLKKTRNLKNES